MTRHHPLNRLLLITALLITLLSGSSCERGTQKYDYSIFAFGTLIDITLYDIDRELAEKAIAQLQTDFDRFHQHWSPWTDGDLARLNQQLADSGTAKLPSHLVPLIKHSMRLSQLSDNYFNPTIGKLINLWQFHRYQEADIRPPEDVDIQQLLQLKPTMSDLSFTSADTLSSKNRAVSLNFGAYAKGYAIQLEMQKLRKLGINNAVINAGGDLSVIGKVITGSDKTARAWNIGIRDPRHDGILASVELDSDESVFTSGDYERFYFYQGKRYHHILDPATGYPTQDAQSVTVIHRDAGLADAAATALFVAGSKHWLNIANKMGVTQAMLIDAAGTIRMTAAMAERIKILDKSPALHKIVVEEL